MTGKTTVLRGHGQGQGRKAQEAAHGGVQCQGQPCVSALLDLAPRTSPAASWLSPVPGTDFPQPQPAGAPWAIRFLPRSSRSPSGGGQAPHQQRQERQEGHRRPPCSLTDPALTVAVSGLKGRSGGSGCPRAHTGGGAVQELGTHRLGGVRLGFDAALGEAPVVDALEEVGVTCREGGEVGGAGPRLPTLQTPLSAPLLPSPRGLQALPPHGSSAPIAQLPRSASSPTRVADGDIVGGRRRALPEAQVARVAGVLARRRLVLPPVQPPRDQVGLRLSCGETGRPPPPRGEAPAR